jgi:hypothetical protein
MIVLHILIFKHFRRFWTICCYIPGRTYCCENFRPFCDIMLFRNNLLLPSSE